MSAFWRRPRVWLTGEDSADTTICGTVGCERPAAKHWIMHHDGDTWRSTMVCAAHHELFITTKRGTRPLAFHDYDPVCGSPKAHYHQQLNVCYEPPEASTKTLVAAQEAK